MKVEGKPAREKTATNEIVVTTETGIVKGIQFEPMEAPQGEAALLLPGTATTGVNKPLGRMLANAKPHAREVYLVDHNQKSEVTMEDIRRIYPGVPEAVLAFGIETLRRAHEAIVLIDAQGIQPHVVAHSYGAMVSVAVALLKPGSIRSLTLINPAGLIEKRSSTTHSLAFIKDLITKNPSSIWDFLKYAVRAGSKASKEGAAIAGTEMGLMLVALAESGVRVRVVTGSNDTVFPSKKIQEQLAKAAESLGVSQKVELRSIEDNKKGTTGRHMSPIVNPLYFANMVGNMLAENEG